MRAHHPEEADRLFATLLAQSIEFPPLLHFAGLNALDLGRIEEGLALLNRSLELDPHDPAFQTNLATALIRLKRWEEAEQWIRLLRAQDPNNAQTALALARLLHETARDGEAIAHWQTAMTLDPQGSTAWLGYGESLTELGDLKGAAKAYAHAQTLLPKDPLLRVARADILSEDDQGEDARILYEEALKLQPDFVPAVVGLAGLEGQLGQFEAALNRLRQLLARNPRAYPAAWLLARYKTYRANDSDIPLLEATRRQADAEPSHPLAHNAYFAWGKILEDLEDYDRAWDAFERGHALKPVSRAYQPSIQRNFLRLTRDALDGVFLKRNCLTEPGPVRPVYIVGMPRSGTTLTEQLLAAHSQVTPGGEMVAMQTAFRQGLGIPDLGQLPFALNPLSPTAWRRLRHEVDTLYQSCARGKKILTDKMPSNFQLCGLLYALNPEARVIHVRREARDTCTSCYTTLFRSSHKFASNLEHLGHYYRMYETVMDHWRNLLPPHAFLEIDYESLVLDPRTELARLLQFLELPWEEGCLKPERVERRIKTASIFQVRQPIQTSSIGRWQRYARHLGPLEAALAISDPLGDHPASL
ncbi:MAG: tetratricopeptide repeat-containing sulfotransferase family protein [Gammaproteobacteria bacterium]